ncbi:hypothetical protein FOZ60_013950 [Perkinsus olseni]|uniref:Uncharacterized protein n=1 Tax=Perkinsus olseni TaxID=32597 RepID=A0A7J6P803_PEROL|nr:hypothetical protein FOZ60_013950 [Perkinsus olseni]
MSSSASCCYVPCDSSEQFDRRGSLGAATVRSRGMASLRESSLRPDFVVSDPPAIPACVKPISELNRYACPFVPSTESNNQQKENGVAQEVQQASQSVGETVHYESCTLQFTAVNKGSDGEDEAMDMIAVYQPTNHVLQSCVTAGRCCIPWHAKSPHIHMVPMLYNAPAAAISDAVPDGDNELENPPQSVGRKDDSSVSEEGSSVTKSERREKDKSEFSPLWKKRLVIKKGAIYWSSSLNYVLSKTKFTRNEINWESTTGEDGLDLAPRALQQRERCPQYLRF